MLPESAPSPHGAGFRQYAAGTALVIGLAALVLLALPPVTEATIAPQPSPSVSTGEADLPVPSPDPAHTERGYFYFAGLPIRIPAPDTPAYAWYEELSARGSLDSEPPSVVSPVVEDADGEDLFDDAPIAVTADPGGGDLGLQATIPLLSDIEPDGEISDEELDVHGGLVDGDTTAWDATEGGFRKVCEWIPYRPGLFPHAQSGGLVLKGHLFVLCTRVVELDAVVAVVRKVPRRWRRDAWEVVDFRGNAGAFQMMGVSTANYCLVDEDGKTYKYRTLSDVQGRVPKAWYFNRKAKSKVRKKKCFADYGTRIP